MQEKNLIIIVSKVLSEFVSLLSCFQKLEQMGNKSLNQDEKLILVSSTKDSGFISNSWLGRPN